MSDQEQVPETLAVFVLDNGAAAKRLLEAVEKIDEVNDNVQIVDAAIAERTKRRGAVKVHQTRDRGALKGGVRGTAIGVVVGTIIAGPAGAVVAGAAGGLLHSLRSRFHDIGIDDKFMKQVAKEIEKGKSALFVQYTGTWAASIGLVEQAIQAENALLITSTLPAETAAALRALVEPAAESLGGDEVVADFEIEVEEAPEEDAAPAAEAAAEARRRRRPDPAGRDRTQGGECLDRGRDRDLRRAVRSERAADPPSAPRCRHDATGQRVDVADAGIPRQQGRLAGPDEAQREAASRCEAGRAADRDCRRGSARRPDPDQRHRSADLDHPERGRDHDLRRSAAREHRGAAPDHRGRGSTATLEPRELADAGLLRGAR